MIAITVRIFWGFGKLALLLRSIYLEHLEGGPATPRAHPKIAFFQSTIPPTTPSHGTCGENELGEVVGGGVSLGWRSTCKCAHTRTHTHTPADRTRTQKDAFIPILEVQTVAPQACPPTHPPLAWGRVDGAAMVAAPLNWATTAPTAVPCSQRGAAQHQTRLRDHAQQVWIEQRVLDKHESTHVSTFTCEALVRPLGAHTRSAALLSPSMA